MRTILMKCVPLIALTEDQSQGNGAEPWSSRQDEGRLGMHSTVRSDTRYRMDSKHTSAERAQG
jgi:hypothetical protein